MDISHKPTVDVIIPCRNEENYIASMLKTVIEQDYDRDKLTIWVIDGESSDKTKEKIKSVSQVYPQVKLLNNPSRTTPHALNVGINNSHSDFVVRMDCHAEYPSNYVSTLIQNSLKLNADNVGAALETLPAKNTNKAAGIALALSLPISVGNSMFRIGGTQVVEVDTVPFGCFKRSIFEKVGLFDEEMLRNQDDEFNARIKKSGGKIFLLPDLIVKYFPRSDFKSLWRMYFQYGEFKLRSNLKSKSVVSIRQFAPMILIAGIIGAKFLLLFNMTKPLAFLPELAYILLLLSFYFFSDNSLVKKASSAIKMQALIATIIIHFSYGLGYFKGIMDYLLNTKKTDLSISR